MNKNLKKLAVVMMLTAALVMALAGCGPKKPTADDAKNYVQAVLDVMCTGDYDHSVEIADIEEGKETELRDKAIDEIIDELAQESALNDEVKAGLKDYMVTAFSKAKYTVTDAVESEDGGYDVTVSIEPMRAFDALGEDFQNKLMEKVMEDPQGYMAMSEEEQLNYLMTLAIEFLNEGLEDPQYDPAQEVVVHYGLMDEEENIYGCTEAEGKKLGEKLFSTEGL